ncbi:hypothetical protein DPMN_116634 [Dreissena polymorpha]|uniref:Uncharacterized protein n=1 Tax=Dreissena polymorpha TaxID=45954 RepID=A0A9D4KND6_DREPO|nr:hypothetical protein DPMN_115043 [Dreissena polymorpha]KAH3843127.1 hypothetical protein DPMN_116634 [Dreissena polymorpha]
MHILKTIKYNYIQSSLPSIFDTSFFQTICQRPPLPVEVIIRLCLSLTNDLSASSSTS